MSDQTLIENTESLAAVLRRAHSPIFKISALLAGAEALLERAESMPDPEGLIWNAAEIVRHSHLMAQELMEGFDLAVRRVERAEKAAAI